MPQDDLTDLVETDGDEPFVLHPGEFVLASTYEVITLGDHLASRLQGKAVALDTEVPTPWGWTTMERLEVGDHAVPLAPALQPYADAVAAVGGMPPDQFPGHFSRGPCAPTSRQNRPERPASRQG